MVGVTVATAWPLSDEQRMHVSRMSELIRRFGAGRYLRAHLVRADERDFPEPWEPTLRHLYALLYRLFWHAYIDAELEIDDAPASHDDAAMLTNSAIDFIEAEAGRAAFQVAAFGNDDIAGLVSHAVGEAFLALAPVDPFRETAPEPTSATDASLAASYLGLGVLVANSSAYRRYKSRLVGREVHSEQRIETAGGLSIADATLLLAIQLTVRDDVPDAVDTLHAPQREWLDQWLAVLDPHEAELRSLLGLDDADDTLPARAAEPRTPPEAVVERALATRNEGLLSFRVPRRRHHLWAGLGLGLAVSIGWRLLFNESVLLLLPLPIGALGGYLLGRPGFACYACKHAFATELAVCPSCRVTLEDTLHTRDAIRARLARFAAQADEVDPEHAEAAERAYHPDV